MVMYLRRATPADIQRLTEVPAAVEDFVFRATDDGSGTDIVDFDKAWHALHFMLTGESYGLNHPLGIIAEEIPLQSSAGIGSIEYSVVSPERVGQFAAALALVGDGALEARFDPDAMAAADVYLADAFLDDEPREALDYILQGVPALRTWAANCAAAGDGAIRVLA